MIGGKTEVVTLLSPRAVWVAARVAPLPRALCDSVDCGAVQAGEGGVSSPHPFAPTAFVPYESFLGALQLGSSLS